MVSYRVTCNPNTKRIIVPIEFDFSRRILKVECGSSNPVFQMTSKRLVEGKHETVDSLHVMEFDLKQGNRLYDKKMRKLSI